MDGTRYDGSPVQGHLKTAQRGGRFRELGPEGDAAKRHRVLQVDFAALHVAQLLQGTAEMDGREHQSFAVTVRMRFGQGEGFAIMCGRPAQVS